MTGSVPETLCSKEPDRSDGKAGEPDADVAEQDPEEQLAKVIREHDANQLFVAFTTTQESVCARHDR